MILGGQLVALVRQGRPTVDGGGIREATKPYALTTASPIVRVAERAELAELREASKDLAVGGQAARRRIVKLLQRIQEWDQEVWEAEHGTDHCDVAMSLNNLDRMLAVL